MASTVNEGCCRNDPDQLSHNIGDEDLTAGGTRRDPCRGVDRAADRIARGVGHFAGVDPDPDARRRGGERPLGRHGKTHCLTRRTERQHHSVAERLHLSTAVRVDPLPDTVELSIDRVDARDVADPLDECSRSLDVSEHDRDQTQIVDTETHVSQRTTGTATPESVISRMCAQVGPTYRPAMATTRSVVPVRGNRNLLSAVLLVAALLWLATGIASRTGLAGDDWEVPYAIFSVLLLMVAATSAGAITVYTAKPKDRSVRRVAAVALAILAVASTIISWAFVVWAVLLAAAFAALTTTGTRQCRDAGWLSAALLAGLAVALVGLWAELGDPGEYNDYSDAQSWGVTVACVLASAVLSVLALRNQRERIVAGSDRPS